MDVKDLLADMSDEADVRIETALPALVVPTGLLNLVGANWRCVLGVLWLFSNTLISCMLLRVSKRFCSASSYE